MTLAHLLERQARTGADLPAILEGTRPWATHAQWAARSAGLAARMRQAGLDAHCLANIARFKRPKRYLFVDALPENNYGKVLKTALRDRLRALF